MDFTFVANACGIYESKGYRLLSDPWFTPGAFEGSWFHYPPPKKTIEELLDVDAIYLSHLHPDHFDEAVLSRFRKNIPIVVLDHPPNFLPKKLEALGFTHLVKLKDKETASLGPFVLTMYAPFTKHPFHECEIGNIVDSALAIEDLVSSFLNTNDNTPSLGAAKMLRERHGRFLVAQLNYNCAGPYPSCFVNLTEIEREKEHKRLIERNLLHMVDVARMLDAEFVEPFAGQYVLGGLQSLKNKALGTAAPHEAAKFLTDHGFKVFQDTQITEPYTEKALLHYVSRNLSEIKYPYEADPFPDEKWLLSALEEASSNMRAAQVRFKCVPACLVKIVTKKASWVAQLGVTECAALLECRMDSRLLARILRGEAHWNNAEIGCHINFYRHPNIYLPDVHTLLCFFHLPKSSLGRQDQSHRSQEQSGP